MAGFQDLLQFMFAGITGGAIYALIALGYTMVLPDKEKYSTTRNEMLDQLAYMLGGRVAEEIVFDDITSGASNDIEQVTRLFDGVTTG